MAVSVTLAIGVALLLAGFYFAGSSKVGAAPEDRDRSRRPVATNDSEPQFVELTEKQTGSLKIAPVQRRAFELTKTAVGTIDFNQNMLVQVFSQYPGKILKASLNLGDEVHQGETLFTIDSPDLLQAESQLLASAGVLEMQTRTLARATQLLRQGGSAQKDVDQSTSDQQTAEGNFKAAKDAVRIFGKSEAEVDQILAQRKIESILQVPSPISGEIVARNAAPIAAVLRGLLPARGLVLEIASGSGEDELVY